MDSPLAPDTVPPRVTSRPTQAPRASTSVLPSNQRAPALRKASKFRHVNPVLKSQTPYLSSPLVPASHRTLSHTSSILLQPSRILPADSHQSESELPVQSTTALTSPSLSERALPSLPPCVPGSNTTQKPIIPPLLSSTPVIQTLSSSSVKGDALPLLPGDKPASPRSSAANRLSIPYRPGFQPKGVLRYLTDDFLTLRTLKRDSVDNTQGLTRVERDKLERRLEKLISLHFPSKPLNTTSTLKRRQGSGMAKEMRRTSSIFDLDAYTNINLRDAGDFWKSVLVGSFGDNSKPDKRGAYSIPWKALKFTDEVEQLWNSISLLGRKIQRYQNVRFVREYPHLSPSDKIHSFDHQSFIPPFDKSQTSLSAMRTYHLFTTSQRSSTSSHVFNSIRC